MKSAEEIMEILEAYDLTSSFRAAAKLAGCDHHTVARYVALREEGRGLEDGRASREKLIDPYLSKIEELVERSSGEVRADVVHAKLEAMGFCGSERTTRRAVAVVKEGWRSGHRRVYRPWIPEPGMWMQWDFADGPTACGRKTYLWCAWLAWSRYRVVFPVWDRTMATVIGCLDSTLRKFGGVPTYALTDNEKTVTIAHVAGLPVRNAEMVVASRHYGITVATCVPADPESKGGVEATVRIAKADLVPTDANLLPAYESFADLKAACEEWCEKVNERPHRERRRAPALLLAQERPRLHPLPEEPFTAAFGQTRRVNWDSTISFGGVRYSVPHTLADKTVWVREHGDEVVVVHPDPLRGAVEVARHLRSAPGNPRIEDAHYPPSPPGALSRRPRPRSLEEEAFLAIGEGARLWLVEATAAGVHKIHPKMEHARQLSRLYGKKALSEALQIAARSRRFSDEDLSDIIVYRRSHPADESVEAGRLLASAEAHTLQHGTASWGRFGR